jgi:hypothetical protein
MATIAGILNTALQQIKVSKRVTGLDQNNSKEASAFDEVYEDKLAELLEMHKWNFATKRVQLARLSTTPPFEWLYEYQLPHDFIRVHRAYDNSDGRGGIDDEIAVEEGVLRTDATSIYLKYVYRVTDPNLMTPTFRSAFAKLLASQVAVSLTNDTTLRDRMYREFQEDALPTAKSIDSLQDAPEQMPESNWVTCRYGSAWDNDITPAEPT